MNKSIEVEIIYKSNNIDYSDKKIQKIVIVHNRNIETIYGIKYEPFHIDDIDLDCRKDSDDEVLTVSFCGTVDNNTDFHNMIYTALAMLVTMDTAVFVFRSSMQFKFIEDSYTVDDSGITYYPITIRDILPLIPPKIAKTIVDNIMDRAASYQWYH